MVVVEKGGLKEKRNDTDTGDLFYARKMKKEERLINWNNNSVDIRNLVRALYKRPTAGFFYKNRLIKVFKVQIIDYEGKEKPGTVLSFNRNELFTVKTNDGAVRILNLQTENKNPMNVKDFINGYRIQEGELL